MTVIVNFIGAPSVGKSTMAAKMFSYTSEAGFSSHLVTESVKDWALRKIPIKPINHLWVAGNQSHLITAALDNEFDIIFSDTSLPLIAFYANYYSNNSFPEFINSMIEWEASLSKVYSFKIHTFFVFASKLAFQKLYLSSGRYEDFEQCLRIQEDLWKWLKQHNIKVNMLNVSNFSPEEILKLVCLCDS